MRGSVMKVTTNLILENILMNQHFILVALSHFTLYPKAMKFKGWLLKNEPWSL
jgi:hypothetical protein